MVTARLTTAIKVLFSGSAHVTVQKRPGEEPHTIGFGHGDIKDLLLMARAMKQSYDGFMDTIQEIAAETGELHALQELKDALEVIDNGGN